MHRVLKFCLICGFSFLVGNAHALESDKTQPAAIDADTATLDRNKGIGIYTGHVIVTQGSMKLTADKLLIYRNKDNKIDRAIAYGAPAVYEVQPNLNEPFFHAKAKQINYFPIKKYVILMGDASLSQGNNSLSGPYIEYDMIAGVVKTKKARGERTTIIIHPNEIDGLAKTTPKS